MKTLQEYIDKLNSLNFKEMYENDFFLTWEKTDEELEAVWTVIFIATHISENRRSGWRWERMGTGLLFMCSVMILTRL